MFLTKPARWILTEPDPDQVLSVMEQAPGLPPILQRLLALRGIAEDGVDLFLNPRLSALADPFELPNMEAAARRILQAVERKERVILYGDYDVDGVTSMAQIALALRAYGLDPGLFLPHRMDEGYGLSMDGLTRCLEELGTPHLLIALDCGTNSVAEVAWLRECGVETVIVDHHEPDGALPHSVALVNPKLRPNPVPPFCTAGLAFKLVHAMLKLGRLPDFDLRDHLDLAALGTVADMVPLRGENRILVSKGLQKICAGSRAGLRALKAVAGLDGHVDSHHIGFRLGPRLNASGRLDHAQASLDLMLSDDPEECHSYAAVLDALNRERQEVELRAQQEAQAMLAANPSLAEGVCLVLGSRGWHPGVVGIVASRLMRDHHRPTLVIAFDENGVGRGSGRSVPGISMVEAINECRSLLLKGGGHAMAVGVSVEEKNLPELRRKMRRAVERQLEGAELLPTLELDAECTLADFTESFFDEYAQLEPFGTGNPEPLFLLRNVMPQLPGQIMKEKHWKLSLRQQGLMMPAIWFAAPFRDPPKPPWDLAVKLQRQVWRGRETWSVLIHAARSATTTR
jgi:single-stranded-DNA-specific exonuclease